MTGVKKYLPLIVLILLTFLMSLAITWGQNDIDWARLPNFFMGFFFCQLSMFKLFDISGFADGFQKYDILSVRFRPYAYIYPFIELLLGLLFLSGLFPLATNIATLIIMTISAFGVIRSLIKGLDIRCACLGTVLNVPLSTVSVVENAGMAIMAVGNIIALMG